MALSITEKQLIAIEKQETKLTEQLHQLKIDKKNLQILHYTSLYKYEIGKIYLIKNEASLVRNIDIKYNWLRVVYVHKNKNGAWSQRLQYLDINPKDKEHVAIPCKENI